MSSTEDPEGCEHVGDEYVTYNRHGKEGQIIPPFLTIKRKRHIGKQREGQSVKQRG
jgi:hypothetical protein